jgi:hypothetical protein
MTRLATAVLSSMFLAGTYSVSPLVAVATAAAAAAVLTAAIAIALHRAERAEIAHVMEIIDACPDSEPMPEPVQLVC